MPLVTMIRTETHVHRHKVTVEVDENPAARFFLTPEEFAKKTVESSSLLSLRYMPGVEIEELDPSHSVQINLL